MKNLSDLTTAQLRKAIEIKERIQALENELSEQFGRGLKAVGGRTSKLGRPPKLGTKVKKKRKMSAAGRARIAAAARARWAKVKAAGKNRL